MAMSMSLLILLGIAALIGLLVAGVRAESKNGGEEMIKKVYVYLVLFATLMMTIGGGVAAFMAIADIVAPTGYYQSFEEYRQIADKEAGGSDAESVQLSEAQLQTRYEAVVKAEKERQTDRAVNSLIKSLGWIVIPLPIFIFFQRKLRLEDFNQM